MAFVTLGLKLATVTTSRAAVIPYTIKEGKLYFLLGQDKQSGDITDFGGGVKQFETTLVAALRELDEESDEILGKFDVNDSQISRAIALLNKHMGTLFIPLSVEWFDKAPKLFEERKKTNSTRKKSHQEIEKILWVDSTQFKKLLRSNSHAKLRMWNKLCSFYRNGFDDTFRSALIAASAV